MGLSPAQLDRISFPINKATILNLVGIVACVVLTSVLFVLALPLGEQHYLAWFMFCPLLAVTRGRGLLTGVVAAVATVFLASWISISGFLYHIKSVEGNPSWVYSTFGIYGCSLALVVGVWGDSWTKRMKPWWFAAVAVLLESLLLLNIPAHVALTQYRQSLLLVVASFGGVWLVSYLIWWANFSIVSLPRLQGVIFGVGLALVSGLGSVVHFSALNHLQRFGIVQVAQPTEESMTARQEESSRAGAVLSVWPEFGGIPFVLRGSEAKLARLSTGPGTTAFVTSFEDEFRPLPHNVSVLFRYGVESSHYYKRKLFGGEAKMHTSGTQPVAADYNGGRAGLNICFDSCYPSIVRDTALLPGVNIICLPSTDPVAPNNFVSAMHAAYTPFRSAEEGVAFVKADGAAYSLITDPYGQIVAQLPAGDSTFVAEVSTETHPTFYKRIGDWVLWALGAVVLVGVLNKLYLSIKGSKKSSE